MKTTELKRKTPLRSTSTLKPSKTPRKASVKAKPKRVKSKPPKWLKKRCDDLTSLIVRHKGEGKCVQCGSSEQMTNGHVFSRRHLATRWDTHEGGNCYAQCWSCNWKHVRDQHPYFDWYIRKYGYESFTELRSRFETIRPMKMNDLRELHLKLESEWSKLQRLKDL